MSKLRRGSPLWRLLHGDAEGTYRVRKGTISYSYSNDQFHVRDNHGKLVELSDSGIEVEWWLISNGWYFPRT